MVHLPALNSWSAAITAAVRSISLLPAAQIPGQANRATGADRCVGGQSCAT